MDWSLIQKIATMNGWFYPSWYSWNANQIHQSLRRLLQPKRTTWVAPILPWDLKRFSQTPKKTLRPHTSSCPSKPGVNMLNIIELDGKIYTGKPLINLMVFNKKHGFRCRGHPSGWTMRTSHQGNPRWTGGGMRTSRLPELSPRISRFFPFLAARNAARWLHGAGKMVKNRFLGLLQQWIHRIGWWENLQESPIFDGKNNGFLSIFP